MELHLKINERLPAFLAQGHLGDPIFVSGHSRFHDLMKSISWRELIPAFDKLREAMDLDEHVEIIARGHYADKGMSAQGNYFGDFVVEEVTIGGVIVTDALNFLDGVNAEIVVAS